MSRAGERLITAAKQAAAHAEITRLVEARARAICEGIAGPPGSAATFDDLLATLRAGCLREARATLDADAALGLAPETLAGLMSGRLVAVPAPKPDTEAWWQAGMAATDTGPKMTPKPDRERPDEWR